MMNKLLKDFTTDDLYQLVSTHMYKDLAPVHGLDNTYVSENHKIVVHIEALDKHTEYIPRNANEYNKLMDWAGAAGREPLYIFSTQLGIWEFNLDLVEPEFIGGSQALNINKGEPIMVWYPQFNSEDEWVDAAMEELSEARYTDPAEMDLEGMMEELLAFDGDYDARVDDRYV